MNLYKGLLNESYQDNKAKKFMPPNIDFSITPIPLKLDWREYGIYFVQFLFCFDSKSKCKFNNSNNFKYYINNINTILNNRLNTKILL